MVNRSRPAPSRRSAAAVPDRHLAAQWSALRRLLHHVSRAVFAEKRPLDRVLSAFWRENRRFGSRDRRLFSETLFGLFRSWGIARSFLSPAEAAAFAAGEGWQLSEEAAAGLAAAAWFYAGFFPDNLLGHLAGRFRWGALPAAGTAPASEAALTELAAALRRARHLPPGPECRWSDLLPDWAAARLQGAAFYPDFAGALLERPYLWLRCQNGDPDAVCRELEAANLSAVRHPRIEQAVAVTAGTVNLFTLDLYRQGKVEVQDLASQAIVLAAAPRPGQRWLDACAGAGGKTLAMADAMRRTGTVVASDIRAYKLDDLRKRARRAAFPNIVTRPWDGGKFSGRQAGCFDGVLVDAPCSCSGVWLRNPDGRWTAAPEDVDGMSVIQRQVLDHAAPAVRPGGVLVYATCSIFPEEDEAVVRDFLAAHTEFELEAYPDPLTGAATDGMSLFNGAPHHADSMFAARLRRKN